MRWLLLLAVTAVTAAAFLAGLLVFRIKQRWCPVCGATLTCPDPTYHHPTVASSHRRNAHAYDPAPATAGHPPAATQPAHRAAQPRNRRDMG